MAINKKLLEEINSVNYLKISPKDYSVEQKKIFYKNKPLWYKFITPKIKADELYEKTNGDYSLIWEERCACCFKVINRSTTENVYASYDKFTWLCERCYNSYIIVKS